ncbi:MAG: T9SS type A sorting domain-containing protein [Flavobacteriales bacterium]
MQILNLTMNSRRYVSIGAASCWLFGTALLCEAQGNLIPNPSFEDADTCAVQMGYLPNGRPQHWFPVSDTPEYFRSCVPYGSPNGVPVNTFGYQMPKEGDSYSGMAAHLVDNYREMIGTELLEPLTVGQTYYGSFWANAAYGGPQQTGSGCNNIGMLFTMDVSLWESGMPQFGLRNHAQLYSQQVVSDTAGWTLVSGSFTADSAYPYLVLGNHFSNANTTLQILGPGDPNKAYVFVDAVCLSTDAEGCPMQTAIDESSAGMIGLWPNPASEWILVNWGHLSAQTILVMDALGKLITAQEVRGKNEVRIATRDLPNGIYQIWLGEDGARQSLKFIVLH